MSDRLMLEISNGSNGECENFYIEGQYASDEFSDTMIQEYNPELLEALKKNSQVIGYDIVGYDNDQEPSTIEEILEFISRRNQDVEFILPDDMLYKDFYTVWNLIAEDVDWEAITPAENYISVTDVDSGTIDDVIRSLEAKGYHLEAKRYNIANGYHDYYERDE